MLMARSGLNKPGGKLHPQTHDASTRPLPTVNDSGYQGALCLSSGEGGWMRVAVLDQSRKLFEQHGFFGQLSQSDLDTVLSHARLEHHRARELIFAKGSPGRSMMAVLRGS